MNFLNLLTRYLTTRVQGSLMAVVAPLGPMLRQLSIGIGSVTIGIVSFLFALFFLALSFFFFLIDRAEWSVAGLWTCLLLGLVGLVFALIGRSLLTNVRQVTH